MCDLLRTGVVLTMILATAASVGAAVRAHTIVTLGGVGKRHSGKYLCAAVTHRIDEGAHAMSVSLLRNALEA